MSQLLRGFAQAFEGAEHVTPPRLAQALVRASEVGYSAVSKPVEGTILTVARATGDAAKEAADDGHDLPGVLGRALHAATEAVAETPNQLEVLRKAGVVDSGGEGYRVIVEAAWMWSTGRSLEEAASASRPHSRALLEAVEEEGPAFGFCTEFLLRHCDVAVEDVKSRMEELGESVIAVGDRDLLRIHVHTLRPGQALEFAVDHGTVAKVKVENMQLQHEEFAARSHRDEGPEGEPVGSIGVVAVAAGEGFVKVFRSLGASVVQGGQTMNPSVQDILAAVNSSGYKEVVILPNNSNIVLTARQVKDLTPHVIEVVATETTPQGIGALLAFNFETDLQTNVAAMEQAGHGVHTIEVTRSVRDAEVDGLRVTAGQMLGMCDGRVVVAANTAQDALLGSFDHAAIDALEIVTIYFGAGASEAEAQAAASRLRDAHPGLAVEIVHGGQPHYPFVVSLE
jgi:DAK2 domain fusion protein YloV